MHAVIALQAHDEDSAGRAIGGRTSRKGDVREDAVDGASQVGPGPRVQEHELHAPPCIYSGYLHACRMISRKHTCQWSDV